MARNSIIIGVCLLLVAGGICLGYVLFKPDTEVEVATLVSQYDKLADDYSKLHAELIQKANKTAQDSAQLNDAALFAVRSKAIADAFRSIESPEKVALKQGEK